MFGLNFIPDRGDPRPYIRRLGAAVYLVMDDHALARDIKQISPESTVVYRAWNPDDKEYHHKPGFDVRRWVDTMRPYAVDDIVIQYLNEPQGYEDLAPLVRSCIAAADHAGGDMRLGLPTWGIGHPDDLRIERGELDSLFRKFKQRREAGVVDLYLQHEYAKVWTTERPYHIGRFVAALERSRRIGAPLDPRQIAITEYGRDVGGGAGDGWQSVFSPETYLQFLIEGVEYYRQFGILGVCIYAWGMGAGGSWWSFNIERLWNADQNSTKVLTDGLVKYNEDHPMAFDFGSMYEAEVTAAYAPDGSAMRSGAGTTFAIVPGGAIFTGDTILISERGQQVGNYTWYKVTKGGVTGYIADTTAFAWRRKTTPPPTVPEIPDGIVISPAKMNELKAAATTATNAIQTAVEAVAALNGLIASLPTA